MNGQHHTLVIAQYLCSREAPLTAD